MWFLLQHCPNCASVLILMNLNDVLFWLYCQRHAYHLFRVACIYVFVSWKGGTILSAPVVLCVQFTLLQFFFQKVHVSIPRSWARSTVILSGLYHVLKGPEGLGLMVIETSNQPLLFLHKFIFKYSKTPIYRASWGKGIRPGKLISTVNWG